ncbi:MAG TPA: NTF2 fold immunity protein [Bryobacteraceae bacterium]|jgi:hypothetical protein|nr:NTF2 fold immunity protein [Bryobacteraceae bacterium]
MKRIAMMSLYVLAVGLAYSQIGSGRGFVPKEGFVSNEAVALAIAEAVLTPVYGKVTINSEHPFKATLKGNVWTITGSVPCDGPPGAKAWLPITGLIQPSGFAKLEHAGTIRIPNTCNSVLQQNQR